MPSWRCAGADTLRTRGRELRFAVLRDVNVQLHKAVVVNVAAEGLLNSVRVRLVTDRSALYAIRKAVK